MQRKTLPVVVGILSGLAVFDVLTAWSLLPVPAILMSIVAAAVTVRLGLRRLEMVLTLLATAVFAIHLGYTLYIDYVAKNWQLLEAGKAEKSLREVLSSFDSGFSEATDLVDRISGEDKIVRCLAENDRRETFAILDETYGSIKRHREDYGMLIASPGGNKIAWAGKLPDFTEKTEAGDARTGMRIRRSTTHYWIETHAPVTSGENVLGVASVFRRLEAVYPGVLPGAATSTLSADLTQKVGHRVEVLLHGGSESEGGGDGPVVVGDIKLPDGGVAGRVIVRSGTLHGEKAILTQQGLFAASMVMLILILVGVLALARHLVGRRFSGASVWNLVFLFAVIWAARVGFSLIRNALNLDSIESFTSYQYATQIPTGILRSPADLAITGTLIGVCVSIVYLAKAYRTRTPPVTRKSAGYEAIPFLLLGLIAAAAASGVVLLGHNALGKVLADSSSIVLVRSPFDFSPSHVLMGAGIFSLTASLVLIGASLVQWQISLIRRFRCGNGIIGRPTIRSGVILFVLMGVFAVAGDSWFILVIMGLCFLWALVMDMVLSKRLALGFVGLVLGLAITASVIQFPYALGDFYSKQRESIESLSDAVATRTDAWKISVLEEALADLSDDKEIMVALEGGKSGLDAEALRLWANSILSKAHITSGVYLFASNHDQIGRFSLEEIGDLLEMEGTLRAARLSASPTMLLTRGSFGGKDIDLHIGVVPFFKDGAYLGSVVVSIPHSYSDLESMAGLRPTFFEAIGSGSRGLGLPGQAYSASLISGGRIFSTTAKDFEVGRPVADLGGRSELLPGWVQHRVADRTYSSYFVPPAGEPDGLLLSFRMLSLSDKVFRLMGIMVGNAILAIFIIIIWAITQGVRHFLRRLRGLSGTRLRWSFAGKLTLAFVLIAIIPTLILGVASRGFLRSRFKEVMESKAEESLKLSKLALERLVVDESVHLARNPILIDELIAEPSILGMLISHDVSAAVTDSTGRTLATFGDPRMPEEVLGSVLKEGRSHNFFSVEEHLYAKSAVPVRDVIFPETIRGCAFISRRIDDGLAHRLSVDIGKDINFFGLTTVAASSKRELFVSELMPPNISPDAYVECFLSGKELHFTWQRIGNMDLVVGHSPLRGFDGTTVGAISIPLVFRKDDVGRRLEWTSSAISYLLVIVIGAILIFGLLLAKSMSRPIRELIQGTLRIGSGDLRFAIPRSGDDEIGDLVTSFNKMTVALARSRKTLSERKRYIETILGNVGAGIVSTDWRGRIETFNIAAEKMLGIKGKNARGRDAKNLLKRIGASSLGVVLDEVDAGTGVARKEVGLVHKDGRITTLRAVASIVKGPRGKPMGKVVVFEDVTELIRSKKLIAWSEMARQVAHEIKNPLTPMKLSAQQLLQARRDGVEGFDQVLEASVATIVEQIESLRRIAVEFSQFSRMPERRPELADINKVVEESLGQYERTIGGSTQIVKHLEASLAPVRIDRDELRRVFLNIIENAIQAMPQGGILEIRSTRGPYRGERSAYRVTASSRSRYDERLRSFVEVSFTDTGAGISPEDSERLFEPNFSTKSHGTGLGLAICKGIMDAYGGEILIESTSAVGTCVRIRIPMVGRPTRPRRPQRRDNRGKHHRSRR
jgi:PAS domain S-box-containing protein